MSKVTEILNGYKNYFVGGNKVVQDTAKKRASICATCPYAQRGLHAALLPDLTLSEINGLFCNQCGCPLPAKVRSQNTNCPKNKW